MPPIRAKTAFEDKNGIPKREAFLPNAGRERCMEVSLQRPKDAALRA
jgi:hypothetical protein